MTTDRVGSCPQEIFACDKQFVEDTFALKSSYDVSWSAAGDGYGGPGFNNQETGNCPAGGAGMGNKYCCGAGESPFRLINLNRSQCCGDYSIVANDQSCPWDLLLNLDRWLLDNWENLIAKQDEICTNFLLPYIFVNIYLNNKWYCCFNYFWYSKNFLVRLSW